ncbi:hypothetical protein HAX54_051850 [Datura stramonium]|uniref:Uncharacterized protein n=1 Tax=Datura stramonium TaxID=4076 RepID=A0ABS8WN26_DATST|nr:hypothetical protein [Datura stramonium]
MAASEESHQKSSQTGRRWKRVVEGNYQLKPQELSSAGGRLMLVSLPAMFHEHSSAARTFSCRLLHERILHSPSPRGHQNAHQTRRGLWLKDKADLTENLHENYNMGKIGIGGASLENFLNFEGKKGGKGFNFMDSPINVDDDMKVDWERRKRKRIMKKKSLIWT